MTRSVLFLGWAMLVLQLFVSCKKEKDVPPDTMDFRNGIFVINEGPFQTGTGTISFMNRNDTELKNKIYQYANNFVPLGNIVQSATIVDDKVYIAVNNANKIEVVSLKTFQSIQTIENITSPRYVVYDGVDKVYVSCWDNTVKIINTEGFENIGQIKVGTGPEKMLLVDQTLWILNQGGLDYDSTISIIDIHTDQVIHTLQVYNKPTGIHIGIDGYVWVMCSGRGWNGWWAVDDTEGHLVCIDPKNYSFIHDIEFPLTTEHPEKLAADLKREVLYYNYHDGIYRIDMEYPQPENEPFIHRPARFYGLGFDAVGDVIYVSDPLDYIQNGLVFRYDPEDGSVIDSLEAGIIPGEFLFTE